MKTAIIFHLIIACMSTFACLSSQHETVRQRHVDADVQQMHNEVAAQESTLNKLQRRLDLHTKFNGARVQTLRAFALYVASRLQDYEIESAITEHLARELPNAMDAAKEEAQMPLLEKIL